MLNNFLHIIGSPLWAVTGAYPSRLLAEKPVTSFRAYSLAYFILGVAPDMFSAAELPVEFLLHLIGVISGYLFLLIAFTPKWQVAVLLAWVGTDLIFFATGFQFAYANAILFIVYLIREHLEFCAANPS